MIFVSLSINFHCRYEVPIMSFSILFAESFPSQWEEKGVARKILTEIWKFVAMFIVLVYLCNLRSHLIKGIVQAPPKNENELASTKYNYPVMVIDPMKILPNMIKLKKQNRLRIKNCKRPLHLLINMTVLSLTSKKLWHCTAQAIRDLLACTNTKALFKNYLEHII